MARKKKILVDMQNLKQSIEALQPDRREIAERLYSRLEFMNKTLDELQEKIKADGSTAMFKQGVQEFERESPSLKAYNTTIQRYSLICKQLVDMLPEPPKEQPSDALMEFIKGGSQ